MNKKIKENKKIRQDVNLSKYPIFSLSKNKEEIRVLKTKFGCIEIYSIAKYGLLQISDYKILLALTQIWEEKGQVTDKHIKFSFYEICEKLNFARGGKTNEHIKDSLIRLANVPIIWKKSYFDKKDNKEIEEIKSFRILEDLIIRDKKDNIDWINSEETKFKFNKYILRNLKNNYTKSVYLKEILSFNIESSIILYRYIDYILYKYTTHEILLENLCQKLGFKSYKYKSDRLRKIEKAFNEINGSALSSGGNIGIDIKESEDRNDYKCIFSKILKNTGIPGKNLTEEQAEELANIFNKKTLKEKITTKGVKDIINTLNCPFERAMNILINISFKPSYSPIETFISAIKGKYIVPEKKGNISHISHNSKDLIEKARQRDSFLKKEKEEGEKIDDFYNSLSEEQQKEIKEKAIKLLKSEIKDSKHKFSINNISIKFKIRSIIKGES